MSRISLVVSDVDGTLVTTEKVLTDRSRAAVAELAAAGIGFSVISSRPPFGLKMLVQSLKLRLPMGAFNGAALVSAELALLDQHELPINVAEDAIAGFGARAIDTWLFTADRWLVVDASGDYVDKETRTVSTQPIVVDDLRQHLRGVCKLVGASRDFASLALCETAMRAALGDRASVARSQPYYLDVTPAGTSKGALLGELARRLGVSTDEVVTLGDMENDVSMFRNSGFSIAMGNAGPEVKAAASAVTRSNDEDGFAEAIERIVLPRAKGRAGPI
jgi:Cof subfamily protein (haloacid dehalogenase superfamily)